VRGATEIWSEFLSDIGFTVPEEIVGPDFTEISAEQIEMFGDLDVIVWLATREQVAASSIYPTRPVAEQGRDVYVDAFGSLSGAIGFNSALSLPLVVDRLVPMLAAAVDGDPATPVPADG
jgi:iron complex transport system substrate-binding protein